MMGEMMKQGMMSQVAKPPRRRFHSIMWQKAQRPPVPLQQPVRQQAGHS